MGVIGTSDLNNYKGTHFDEKDVKYKCHKTGAHFKFNEMFAKLSRIDKMLRIT